MRSQYTGAGARVPASNNNPEPVPEGIETTDHGQYENKPYKTQNVWVVSPKGVRISQLAEKDML